MNVWKKITLFTLPEHTKVSNDSQEDVQMYRLFICISINFSCNVFDKIQYLFLV